MTAIRLSAQGLLQDSRVLYCKSGSPLKQRTPFTWETSRPDQALDQTLTRRSPGLCIIISLVHDPSEVLREHPTPGLFSILFAHFHLHMAAISIKTAED